MNDGAYNHHGTYYKGKIERCIDAKTGKFDGGSRKSKRNKMKANEGFALYLLIKLLYLT